MPHFADNALRQYCTIAKTPNGRYKSWEHCYSAFTKARQETTPDIDYLCLHLSFYLASWGMYRGSSFLLQRDYLVHKEAVKLILDRRYDVLQGASCSTIMENIKLLLELVEGLKKNYQRIRLSVYEESGKDIPKQMVSDTLITKILLGTLGCVPAYDQYLINGLVKSGIATGQFGEKSVTQLLEHYHKFQSDYERVRTEITGRSHIEYPPMKILDMAMWDYGYSLTQK